MSMVVGVIFMIIMEGVKVNQLMKLTVIVKCYMTVTNVQFGTVPMTELIVYLGKPVIAVKLEKQSSHFLNMRLFRVVLM